MRLTQEQIKEQLLHTDFFVRDFVLEYYAETFCDDVGIVPWILKCCEGCDDRELYYHLTRWNELPQTEESILRAIERLRELLKRSFSRVGNYTLALELSEIVSRCPLDLVEPHYEMLISEKLLDSDASKLLEERFAAAQKPAHALWYRLKKICKRYRSEEYLSDEDTIRYKAWIEALPRDPDWMKERILPILEKDYDDIQDPPMVWLELFASEIAGLMKLEEAVPHLVKRLHEEDDEEMVLVCSKALKRIGSSPVIDALVRAYPEASSEFRFQSSEILTSIDSDESFEICLAYFDEEDDDDDSRYNFARALAYRFSSDLFPRLLNFSRNMQDVYLPIDDLKKEVVALSRIFELDFSEKHEWAADLERSQELRSEDIWYDDIESDEETANWAKR